MITSDTHDKEEVKDKTCSSIKATELSKSLFSRPSSPTTDSKKDVKKNSVKPEYSSLDYNGLNEDEIRILKDQIEVPKTSISYFTLFRFATPFDLLLLAIAAICSIISGAALPMFTLVFGSITQVFNDFLVNGTDPDEFQSVVNDKTLYFLYLGIGIGVTSYLQTFLHVDRGEVIVARIRKSYLQAVLRQNIGYFDRVGAGEVTSRITNDISQIQDGISEKIGIILSGFSTFIAAFVIGFVKSWRITLIMSSSVVVILASLVCGSIFMVKYITRTIAAVGEASTVAEDVLSSIRNTVAFGAQNRLADKFDSKLSVARDNGIKRGTTLSVLVSWLWCVTYLYYALAFWEGSRLIASGHLDVGSLVTSIMAIIIGAFVLGNIAPSFQAIGTAIAAAYKIFEAIDRVPIIDVSDEKGEKPEDFDGRIEFKGVKFAYPSRPNVTILDNFDLTIEPGQTIALVGASGSGKSTIIGLIERFYAPIGGSIIIDGRNLESLNIKWLRRQMSLVSQEPNLFSCSIYENIAFGLIGTSYEHASDETKLDMIKKACEEANAWEFIQNLTNGLDTEVGDRGFLLSGGQKQRIAIARAIVSQPKLLLLDEATSALDTKSEGIVQEALDRVLKSRTTIVIAHRLSTIRDANKIVVMSNGKIIESGTHNELLSREGAYFLLVKAQNVRAFNEEAILAIEKVSEAAHIHQEKGLERSDTRDSNVSISSEVIEDLENSGYYEPEVKTRSTFNLIKTVSIPFCCHLYG